MDYYYTVAEDMESNVDAYEAASTKNTGLHELNIPSPSPIHTRQLAKLKFNLNAFQWNNEILIQWSILIKYYFHESRIDGF